VRDRSADLIEVALACRGSDDRRAAPVAKLRGERADAAEHPLDEDRLARDGAVAKDRSVRGDPGDPEACADLVTDLVRQLHSPICRNDGQLRGGPDRAV
jgi:hypothetical protein